jgi:DNA-binding transcriptional ArsR family regulator
MSAQLDAVLFAVSDPTRRVIIDRLTKGPVRVTDLAKPLPMSLAAVSKHVQLLEEAGLVRRCRQGREHMLSLDARPLRDVAHWASRYQRYWSERVDRLEAFFKERRKKS